VSAIKIKDRAKNLEKERDALLNKFKELEKMRKEDQITEEEYVERRHKIERSLVEIMDRLAQMNFLMRQK
jgi:hypothetical protein